MITLIQVEFYKLFSKSRTYIALSAVLFIVFAITFALYAEGENYLQIGTQQLDNTFMFQGKIINGYLTSYIILNALLIHIPLLVALVIGDMISGEVASGTLRFLVTRQYSRIQILLSKLIVSFLFTAILVLLMAVLSMAIGILVLGKGDIFIIRDVIYIIEEKDVLWRFALAYSFSLLGMFSIACMAFMFSSFTSSTITPIVFTLVVIVAFTILTSINAGFFKVLKHFFFTNYMNNWKLFFEEPLNMSKIQKSVFILLFHVFAFSGITFFYFNKKDLLG
jgi:ABC-2 type transport system permease protein